MSGASIPIPFAIDEPVWHIGHGKSEEWIECPECAGTKALTIIQGNGDQVSIACACCSLGAEPPTGTVKRVIHELVPTRFTPRRVRICGDEIMYSEADPDAKAYGSVYATDLYADRDECAKRCEQENAKRTEEAEKRALFNLMNGHKKMAWSVHYWGREVKRLERDLERARDRLSASKARKVRKHVRAD